MGRKLFALVVTVLFLYITSPLLLPVLMGGIFAVVMMPLQEKLEARKFPMGMSAGMLTLILTLLILVPVGAMIFIGAKSGFQQLQSIKSLPPRQGGGDWIDSIIDSPHIASVLDSITRWFPIDIDALRESAHDVVHTTSLKLADLLGQFLTAVPGILLGTAVTVVSVFFFLLDGRKLVRFFRKNSLFNVHQTDSLFDTLSGMCRSVILASVASGIAQTAIMTVGCLIMGVGNIPIIAALIFMGSFIPVIGSTPVTVTVVLQQFVTGHLQSGLVMTMFALMVGTVDNFVRPVFLKGSANLHPLVAFVAAFGGLQAFGFVGVFLGPIVAGLFVTTLKIVLNENDKMLHSS
jgi:predicted PurR-regulated permease PerM